MGQEAKPFNVLFTSAGRRVELIRAFRQAYRSLGLVGNVVALDMDRLAPALQVADRMYLVPSLGSPDYISTLLEICEMERIGLIFPLIDPDIPVLAKNRVKLESVGAKVAVVSERAAAMAADKWETMQFFQELGLCVPRSWLPEQLNPGSIDYPLFIKPRRGSAARRTFKINDPDELRFFCRYVPNPIIQEYLPGPEITNDVIADLNSYIMGIMSRKRIEVRWGEVAKGVTVFDPAITEGCIRVAKSLPAVGPITVQCMFKDGVPHFTEINARLGGGVPLGIAAGMDSPRWLLSRAAGLQTEKTPANCYKAGLYMTRYDESFFIE